MTRARLQLKHYSKIEHTDHHISPQSILQRTRSCTGRHRSTSLSRQRPQFRTGMCYPQTFQRLGILVLRRWQHRCLRTLKSKRMSNRSSAPHRQNSQSGRSSGPDQSKRPWCCTHRGGRSYHRSRWLHRRTACCKRWRA
jgi:hypothetical protein